MSLVKSIFNFLRFNKKNWKAVVLCIFAATVFWFFNALNKNYATNLSFPVTFEFDAERYIPVNPLPATVRMNVSGSGWDLFRRSSGFKIPPLVIPLEKPTEVRKIVGSTLPAVFASQLERLQINFVITDTVRVAIEEKLKKKFKVSIDSVNQYIHPDYGLNRKPRIIPDTVWLEGPRAIIASLPETVSVLFPEKNVRRDFKEEVELNLEPKNLITSTPQRFHVSLDVVKFVRTDKPVKLNIMNAPARLRQGVIAREVTCTFSLPENAAATFSEDSLIAIIDLKNKPRGNYKLVPEISGLPEHAYLIKADTVFVSF